MDKDKLIKLWMAQGYLKATPSKEMELVGQEYFENLTARYFFQDFKKFTTERDVITIRLKMHDIVHGC